MNRTALLVAFVITVFLSRAAIAQETAPKPWYSAIQVNGFVTSSLSYNLNTPDSRKNQYRVFDYDDNSFKIDACELVFHKDAGSPGDAGFRIDLTAGSSIPAIARSAGLNGGDFDVQQAYASYIAPIGRGLKIDAGKFVTHTGYELIDGHDGYNDNATRSFLFGYAIPFTHTGLRLGYGFSDAFGASLFLVNGWDVAVDNNRSKTVGAQLSLAPGGGVTCFVNALYGPERVGNNSDNRMLVDFCGTVALSDLVTVGINGDYGAEQRVLQGGGDARWMGVAAYLRLNLLADFSLALRGELFDDKDGVRTGTVQKLTGVTITPEYRPSPGFVVRADMRLDSSDQEVFEKIDTPSKSQSTICLNALFVF
ncbi:MAG: porin [Ignavibacteria bacterium]|nr:porin [Ignavibacteria bacterium]